MKETKASCDWLKRTKREIGGAWRGRHVYRCERRVTLPNKHEHHQIQRWNWFSYPFGISKLNAAVIMSVLTLYKNKCELVCVSLVDAGGRQPLAAAVFGEAVFKVLSVLVSCAVERFVVLYERLDLILRQTGLFIWGHFRFILCTKKLQQRVTTCNYLKQTAVHNSFLINWHKYIIKLEYILEVCKQIQYLI